MPLASLRKRSGGLLAIERVEGLTKWLRVFGERSGGRFGGSDVDEGADDVSLCCPRVAERADLLDPDWHLVDYVLNHFRTRERGKLRLRLQLLLLRALGRHLRPTV